MLKKEDLPPQGEGLYNACKMYLDLQSNYRANSDVIRRQARAILKLYISEFEKDKDLPNIRDVISDEQWNGSLTVFDCQIIEFVGEVLKYYKDKMNPRFKHA